MIYEFIIFFFTYKMRYIFIYKYILIWLSILENEKFIYHFTPFWYKTTIFYIKNKASYIIIHKILWTNYLYNHLTPPHFILRIF